MAILNPHLDEIDQLATQYPHVADTLTLAHRMASQPPPIVAPSDQQAAPLPGPVNAGAAPVMPQQPAPASPSSVSPEPSLAPMKAGPKPLPIAQPSQADIGRQDAYNSLTTPDNHQHDTTNVGTSGINQIHNPWGRIPLQILDAVGQGFFPRLEAAIPGTEGHHQVLVHHAANEIAQDQSQLNDEQKRGLEAAQQVANAAKPEEAAATLGLGEKKLNEKTDNDEGNLAVKQDAQATKEDRQEDLHELMAHTADLSDARAALAKAQTSKVPEEIAIAQRRVKTAEDNVRIAAGRLQNAQANTGLKANEQEAKYKGTIGGEPLAGGQVTPEGKPIGTAVSTATKPTTASKTAGERAETLDNLSQRITKALEDPEIQGAVGPLQGRLTELENKGGFSSQKAAQLKQDLISYGAFQAGLHPVRGIGAIEYFDKVMGGLGQTPEQLKGKLASNAATSQSVQHVGGIKQPKEAAPVDPAFKAYADKYFHGDIEAAKRHNAQ